MDELAGKIKALKKKEIAKLIQQRMQEFEDNFLDEEKIFSELCFCIVTANNRADVGLKVQSKLEGSLNNYSHEKLAKQLRDLGSRFHNNKAKYLLEAKKWENIKQKMQALENEYEIREWLVENVKGLGYKEASHFMRNIGYKNMAILDRHILRAMKNAKLISQPKTLTRRRYLDIEKKLAEVAGLTGLSQSELDLYLWFMQTGKVLK